MSVTHRIAGPADAGDIARVHIASWRSAYRGLLPDWYLDGLDLAEQTTRWTTRLATPKRTVFVAEDADGLAGFCAASPALDADATPAVWQIFNLHVSPDRRNRGIGGALFDHACAWCREHGATRVTLWVAEGNLGARRFYERKGMPADGRAEARSYAPGATLDLVRYALDV